jgi:choice-of-anchor A domain-containing protein
MKKLSLLSAVFSLLLSPLGFAAQINLGQAAEYNAFVQNNFQVSSSDTQGRIAVGGNFIVKPHQYSHDKTNAGYSVGDMVHAPGTPSLVVGGNIELHAQGGGLQIHNTGIDHGTAVYSGTLVNGHKIGSGTASKVNKSELPVDFDAAFKHLNSLSDQLAAMTASATTTTPGANASLTFRPAVPSADKVYVFELTQEMLDSSYGINIEGVESDALVVFNVTNTTGYAMKNYSNGGFCKTGDTGCAVLKLETVKFNGTNTAGDTSKDRNASPLAKQVLFNFNDLSNVKLASNVFGTVLAPKAAIHSTTAPIWGQVIANSWVGNAQINVGPLTPRDDGTPDVAAPPVVALFLAALASLLWFRRRQLFPSTAIVQPQFA